MKKKKESRNFVEDFKNFSFSKKSVAAIIIISVVLIAGQETSEAIDYFKIKYFSKSEFSKEELRVKALELSQDLFYLAEQREKYEPEFNFDLWDESVKISQDYRSETNRIYFQEYFPDVDKIRKELIKYEISDEHFDFIISNPWGHYYIQEIAILLVELANEL